MPSRKKSPKSKKKLDTGKISALPDTFVSALMPFLAIEDAISLLSTNQYYQTNDVSMINMINFDSAKQLFFTKKILYKDGMDDDVKKKLELFFILKEEDEKIKQELFKQLQTINVTKNITLILNTRTKLEEHINKHFYLISNKTTVDNIIKNNDKKLIVDCSPDIFSTLTTELEETNQFPVFFVKANYPSIDFDFPRNVVVYGYQKVMGDNWFGSSRGHNLMFILPLLEKVGNEWLNDALFEKITFNLKSLKTIGNDWLSELKSIDTIIFENLSSVKEVGHNWLASTSVKKKINFEGLKSLEIVGNNWLGKFFCHEISFKGLRNLKTVGNHWLSKHQCFRIIFSDLFNLEKIGNYWLYKSPDCILKTDDFESLVEVGDYWLAENEHIDLTIEGFNNLVRVGNYWLSGCTDLEEIKFVDFESLIEVGSHWLAGSGCTYINFEKFYALRTIGDFWLKDSRIEDFDYPKSLKKVGKYRRDKYIDKLIDQINRRSN